MWQLNTEKQIKRGLRSVGDFETTNLRDATLLLFFVLNGVDHLAAFFHQREALPSRP